MGFLAKLLSFTRVERNDANITDVKVDPGGGSNVVVEHYSPVGDDSHPLPGDPVACIRNSLHRATAVAYADTKNAGVAVSGEVRRYARDANGDVVSYFWLRNDGEIYVNGSTDYAIQFTAMQAAFDQAITDLNTLITAAYNIHTHVVSGSSTGAPGALGTESTADMTNARVDTVRLP